MKIRQLSDLHLETGPFTWEDQGEDVVVLAGDIGVGIAGIEWAKTILKPVIYVAGNHEHWGGDIFENIKAMRLAAKDSNVHFLENDEANLTINGETVRFLGCTLWTDYGEAHCENHPVVLSRNHNPQQELMYHATVWMNDYRYIKAKAWWTPENEIRYQEIFTVICLNEVKFNPLVAYDMHIESRSWLEDKLNEECSHRTVIVTHHAPSYQSLKEAGMIDNHALNQQSWSSSRNEDYGYKRVAAYASDLEGLFGHKSWKGSGVELWLHGHTHARVQYAINGTVVSCNPRGYHRKPLSQKEANALGFWGYPVSKEDMERSEKAYMRNPERGDNHEFERNLVLDMDTMLPELVIKKSRKMLEALPLILEEVLAHKAYLMRKDEVIVKLAGNHIASKGNEFNRLVGDVLAYFKAALKSGNYQKDNNNRNAIDLNLIEQNLRHQCLRAKSVMVNLKVNTNFYMPEKSSLENPDDGFNEQPKRWAGRLVKDMQNIIWVFDQGLDLRVQDIRSQDK